MGHVDLAVFGIEGADVVFAGFGHGFAAFNLGAVFCVLCAGGSD
jgi:hypothetical protein